MEESTFTGTLEEEGESTRFGRGFATSTPRWRNNKQATPVTVTFRVEIDDEDAEEQTETITLRSINDCPFGVGRRGRRSPTSASCSRLTSTSSIRSWTNCSARRSTAAPSIRSPAIIGDAAEVYRQVFAMWDALTARDVRYSDITTTAAESESVYCQHVRLLDETINNGQANCADGSVLFASLLRKIGIEAYLVMVPRHCYLAFALDEKGEKSSPSKRR